jgi:hypothetical protein
VVRRLGFAGLLLVSVVAACGPDASNDPPVRTTEKACSPGFCLEASAPPMTSDSGLGNAPLEPWIDTGYSDVSGVFAMLAVVDANVAAYPVTLRLLFRLRILQIGTSTKQSTTLCAFKLPSVPNLATLVIPPLLQNVIQENSITVTEGPYLSSSGAYNPPAFLLVLGAKLANPATDPLPSCTLEDSGTYQCSPTEWDEDHDGNPGVTVDATVFTCPGMAPQGLFVSLRTGGTISGKLTGPGTIAGTMQLFDEEVVLGYSNSCLSTATEINPKLKPNSPFTAQRLADEAELDSTGNVTCNDILAKAPALFGKDWD